MRRYTVVPEHIKNFIERFSRLPSIGPRLATRLAFHIAKLDHSVVTELAETVGRLAQVNQCPRCFFLKTLDAPLCTICANPARNRGVIALVEKESDLLALEKTGQFTGTYFLLGELPERGALTDAERTRITALKKLIETELGGSATELIIAFGHHTFGDFAASMIREEFKTLAKKITRLGRGIPTGGEVEFADPETLGAALERRS